MVNTIDPWGLEVSIVYRPLKYGSFGAGYHQAIKVNDIIVGYSKGFGVRKEMEEDYGWGSHEKIIHSGNECDQLYLDYLESAAKGNDPRFTRNNYSLFTNNCMSFVNTALKDAIQKTTLPKISK